MASRPRTTASAPGPTWVVVDAEVAEAAAETGHESAITRA